MAVGEENTPSSVRRPQALPILFTFRRCPYAIRARLALRYAGISVGVREVALRDKPAALLQVSPKGTVPVLVLANGDVVDESLDIMHWALGQSDPEGWLCPEHSLQAVSWIDRNDTVFKPLLDRYKYSGRFPEQSMAAHRERAIDSFVRPLAEHLLTHAFVAGEKPTLPDAAIFPFIRQFAYVDKPWFDGQNWPGLQRWLDSWLRSALFASVMLKAPPHAVRDGAL